jgi:DNA-binding XRE family transcriptional regulator
MSLYTYVAAAETYQVDVAQRAFEHFARSMGFPAGIQNATNLQEPAPGGPVLQDTLSRLGKGDTLVVSNLGALGTYPSQIERHLLAAVASGVALHVLDIGRIEGALVPIRAALDAGAKVEKELIELRSHVEKLNEQHAADLDEQSKLIVERMASVFGTRQLQATLDKAQEATGLGAYIRKRREQLGLSQAQLADMVGTSRSSIQRAEVDGTSESLTAILDALTQTQGKA